MADSPSRLRATLEAFLPGQNDLNTDVVSTLGAKVAGDVFPVSISAAAFSMMTQAKQFGTRETVLFPDSCSVEG